MAYFIIVLLALCIIYLIQKKMKVENLDAKTPATYDDKFVGTQTSTNKTFNYTVKDINNPTIKKVSELANVNDFIDPDGYFNLNKFTEAGIYAIDVKYKLKTVNGWEQKDNVDAPPTFEVIVNNAGTQPLYVQKFYLLNMVMRVVQESFLETSIFVALYPIM